MRGEDLTVGLLPRADLDLRDGASVAHHRHSDLEVSTTAHSRLSYQVFDRRSAVKLYRIFAAEHGVVNSDMSC